MEEGVDDRLRDKTRPSRVRPLGQDVAERIFALIQQDPPCEATYWTGAMVAKTVGVSISSVQGIWRAPQFRATSFDPATQSKTTSSRHRFRPASEHSTNRPVGAR
jgi:hypothetical protein